MKNMFTSIRGRCCLTFLVLLLGFGTNLTYAVVPTVVVPNSTTNTEGNSNNAYPFNVTHAGLPNQRYQQLFDASQFANISSGFITQIVFRPDADTGGAFSSTLSDIQINLSTTGAADDALSMTFADNIGSDDTIVFARGSLALSSAFTGPPGGPKDFDIIINLTTPFFYDPSLGNLLLDVRNFGGGFTDQFDAEDTPDDGISRVCTENNGVNSAIANFGDSNGLVTGFTIVPEPGSAALLFAGGGILLTWLGRRRQFRRE